MSMFQKVSLPCPACGTSVDFRAVLSVNADRRPALRDGILDESFQRETCSSCSNTFRLAPDLNYLDAERGQWFASHAVADLDRWREVEQNDRDAFDKAYGSRAPGPAREIGAGLSPRVTFGWAGLREKIFAAEKGLNDVTLELMKMAILRSLDGSPVRDDTELRLIDVQGPTLIFAWIGLQSEEVIEALEVPLDLYQEIEADEAWDAVRAELAGALFVDMNRMLVEGGPVPAAAVEVDGSGLGDA